ncbi:3-hydroxyacyl-ACP dehydratase FabZ [Sutterella sp.]|uniref:3-hydroxyacyl-ACP dehydratase FabZ n=1 Tax=Sutterella sp. TaxID=1981025 RepID=UPI0026E08F48|nr:3-hydroxyacyl-ACP dehydratase FabZ [Sutterella sp.]MDO5531185.1 3-hydroxyacyl-ACP dehydratase FabZ [Sutterella sp.]
MPKSLNILDIMEQLPHRYPFLLIDRVLELSDELDRVVAIKNVTMNEPQFTGHFPQAPVMPGVLIIEAMAQTCAIIALARLPKDVDPKKCLFYFAGIDNARFKRIVQPGDQLVIEGKFIKSKLGMGIFEAVARVDGKVAAQAQMMCAYRPAPQKSEPAAG